MFDYRKIENEVREYAGGFVNDYDIDAVMDELRGIYLIDGDYEGPIRSIDDVDIDDILASHDIIE